MIVDEFIKPDPELMFSYMQILIHGNHGAAWEYLRRNENYRKSYAAHLLLIRVSKLIENAEVSGGITTEDDPAIYDMIETLKTKVSEHDFRPSSDWGLAFYCNPNLTCEDATFQWIDEAASIEGDIQVRPKNTNGLRRDANLAEGSVSICFNANHVYTKIKRNRETISIRSKSIILPDENETLNLNLTKARHLSKQTHRIIGETQRTNHYHFSRNYYAKLKLHINRIRAFDAHSLGFSDRETSKIIFCETAINFAQDYRDNIRSKIRKLRKEAAYFVDGGYIKLVRARSS